VAEGLRNDAIGREEVVEVGGKMEVDRIGFELDREEGWNWGAECCSGCCVDQRERGRGR
jgi:hypothetical protein